MLTVRGLISGPDAALRPITRTPASFSSVVKDVVLVSLDKSAQQQPVRGALVLLTADASAAGRAQQQRADRLVAHLVREQALGVVAVDEASQLALLTVRERLPLFVPHRPCTGAELQDQLLRAQLQAERSTRQRTEELISLASRLDRSGEGPEEVLRLLERETGASVAIIDADADEESGSGPQVPAQLLDRVAGGHADTASDENSGHLLLHALGGSYPRPVLAAAGTTAWTGEDRAFLATAALHISLLRQPLARRAQQQRLTEKDSALREIALHSLMRGKLAPARLALKELRPRLLSHPRMQFGVLRCPRGDDRVRLREEIDRALGYSALVVLCPAEPADLLVLWGVEEEVADTATAQKLLPLVKSRTDRKVGLSQPQPWERTGHTYNAATNALAQTDPHHPIATNQGARCIALQLPPWAYRWAEAALQPLESEDLSPYGRESLLELSYRALTIGTEQTARAVAAEEEASDPLRPNTVSARLSHLGGLLGLGSSKRDRAVLHFLLDVAAHPPEPGTPLGGPANPTLADVLSTPEAKSEAHTLLAPLETPQNARLLEALVARATSTNVDAASAELGISRRALQKRLTTLGRMIGRQMSGPPWGWLHEVIIALAIAGHISQDLLTDPSLRHTPG